MAQSPPPDLNGEPLRQWMRTVMYDDHFMLLGYTEARLKMYNYIDNKEGVLTGVYSGYTTSVPYGGTITNPTPINCEHTVPQSFFGAEEPMKSDVHHLFPTYSNWNSTRGNNPYGEIDDNLTSKWMYLDAEQTYVPSSGIDDYSEYGYPYFEPREDHKGNVARAIFYFYTMYPTQAGDIGQIGDVNTFYQWHLADPVDTDESFRNDDIEFYQGNRNPYVDFPDVAKRAWGLMPQAGIPDGQTQLTITPGNMHLQLDWTDVASENGYRIYRSTDNVEFDLLVTLGADMNLYFDYNIIADVPYFYYVVPYNTSGTGSSSSIENDVFATIPVTVTASDLLFSEYIEGSSYNKALEITNFTGEDIDLSDYELKRQTNGAGLWSSPLPLNGILEDGAVWVVSHSSADSDIHSVSDMITGSSVVSFNGNDPIGLFKNGILIDIIGNFDAGSNYFASDVTMVRKAGVSTPRTDYTIAEWDVYPTNTSSYLGSHTFDPNGGGTIEIVVCNAPTGIVVSNLTMTTADISWNPATDIHEIQYRVIGSQQWLNSTAAIPSVNLTNLLPGTTYEFRVRTVCPSGMKSEYSSILTFDTEIRLGETAYCDIQGEGELWIERITLNDFKHTSGNDGGYGNHTNQHINLEIGESGIIIITSAGTGKEVDLKYVVWVDWNQDGDFMDHGEEFNPSSESKPDLVLYNNLLDKNLFFPSLNKGDSSREVNKKYEITVPSYALIGKTRMRIAIKKDEPAHVCEMGFIGEAEDYSLVVMGTSPRLSSANSFPSSQMEFSIFPNPASDFIQVEMPDGIDDRKEISVVNAAGKTILHEITSRNQKTYDVRDWIKGIYFIRYVNGEKILNCPIIIR